MQVLQALSLKAELAHCQGSLPKLPFLNTSMLTRAALNAVRRSLHHTQYSIRSSFLIYNLNTVWRRLSRNSKMAAVKLSRSDINYRRGWMKRIEITEASIYSCTLKLYPSSLLSSPFYFVLPVSSEFLKISTTRASDQRATSCPLSSKTRR